MSEEDELTPVPTRLEVFAERLNRGHQERHAELHGTLIAEGGESAPYPADIAKAAAEGGCAKCGYKGEHHAQWCDDFPTPAIAEKRRRMTERLHDVQIDTSKVRQLRGDIVDGEPLSADAIDGFRSAARSLKQAETAFRDAQQAYAEAVKRLSEEAVK